MVQVDRDKRELEYRAFIDMLASEPFRIFRDSVFDLKHKYEKNITTFLRSAIPNEEAGQKARLAQAMMDTIDNIFDTHIETLKKQLNPAEKESDEPGQVY